MSSVFSDYQALQEQLVKPTTRRMDAGSTGLLKAEIPVCVTLSNDPRERWNLACINLRWLISESSTMPMRQGAIISILSLHSDNMRAHATLASKAADAAITVLEVDNVDLQNGILAFNPRSGVPDKRAQQLLAIADDLPKSCPNNSPLVTRDIEESEPLDLSETIERLQGIAIQVWVAAIKSMTAPDTASESESKRLAKYQQQGRLMKQVMLHNSVRQEFLRVIRSSLVIRHFMINECRRAATMGNNTSRYYAIVGDISLYFKNAGLTAFFLTLKFGVGTKYPTLAMSALSGELKKLAALIKLYRNKGEDAAYMAFLEDPDMGHFAPANYSTIYSYAMGVGTVLESSVTKYQFAREFTSETFFRLGVETAQSQQASIDETTAVEMGLTREARNQVKILVENLDLSAGSDIQTSAPQFLDESDSQPQVNSRSIPTTTKNSTPAKPSNPDGDDLSMDW
ncbi:nucleocapsid [avian paramyxovirus 15]|uniref:Nucleocapsid n=1 Tax=avian paramyxovirus 15 TaxID=1983777 RepID=A0A1W6R4X6_9MONO|nr:nucleocapsid [Avian paramyxovirus 15]ARO49353.1 nucleocapsid [Avian paramyxovirus 15]